MRYTFPHFNAKPEFVQPDYSKWDAVEIGMARDEVVELLGPPLEDEYHGGKVSVSDPYYTYGYLQMPLLPHPRTYEFEIGFDDNDNVFAKIDPFNGRFSPDGLPTVPEMIIPTERAIFSHYPRILDCRWFPSSGVFPITYTVECGFGESFESECFTDEEIESGLEIPFLIATFGGANTGRYRVKAKNELGESDWSDYRYFRFTV